MNKQSVKVLREMSRAVKNNKDRAYRLLEHFFKHKEVTISKLDPESAMVERFLTEELKLKAEYIGPIYRMPKAVIHMGVQL